MNILSFCRFDEPDRFLDFDLVQATDADIHNLNISPALFQTILIDNLDTLDLLRHQLTQNALLSIPVIMLLRGDPSYSEIRTCLDSGASDFSLEPYGDLKQIIINNIQKLDDFINRAESRFNRLRKSLTFTIPHEFYTPLTAILGLSSILAKEPIKYTAIVKEFCINIWTSANRLRRHIDNFIYYSHLQLKLASNCEICYARSFIISNPDQIIKLVIHELQYNFKRKIKHRIQPAPVQCNETNFYKLIYNLLDNALKFSKNDSIVLVESEPIGDDYQIVIYNEGSGFDQEQLKLIGAFTQFDRETNEQQGIGMGMAIAISLIKLYNGRINILSEKKRYTKIEILLKKAKGISS